MSNDAGPSRISKSNSPKGFNQDSTGQIRENNQVNRSSRQTGNAHQPLNSVSSEYPLNNSNQVNRQSRQIHQPRNTYNQHDRNNQQHDSNRDENQQHEQDYDENQQNREENFESEEDEFYYKSEVNLGKMQEIMSKTKSYTEKMDLVAEEIKKLTTLMFTVGGYNSFTLLKNHFKTDNGVDGEVISDYMGYNSFADMCLNAPEIVDLHKWTHNDTGAVLGYQPVKIDKISAKHVNDKAIGQRAREVRYDEIGHYIDEMVVSGTLPKVRELDFKYRLCKTVESLDGLREFVNLGALKIAHHKMHNEVLNGDTYRREYSLKSGHNFVTIQKERLRIEMTLKPDSKNAGLVHKLRRSLADIKDYHDRVKEEIRKKELKNKEELEELARIGYIKSVSHQP